MRLGADELSAGGLKQFAQLVQVLGAGVADHEIAKAVVAPVSDFKGKGCARRFISARVFQSPLLENKDRNLVLADAKNEFRARRLAEIADLPAFQDER